MSMNKETLVRDQIQRAKDAYLSQKELTKKIEELPMNESNLLIDRMLFNEKTRNQGEFNNDNMDVRMHAMRYHRTIARDMEKTNKLLDTKKDNLESKIAQSNKAIMINENNAKIQDSYLEILGIVSFIIFLLFVIYSLRRLNALSALITGYIFIAIIMLGIGYIFYVLFFDRENALAKRIERATALTAMEFKKAYDNTDIAGDCSNL